MECEDKLNRIKSILDSETDHFIDDEDPIRIVVGHRGWVWVGRYTIEDDGLCGYNVVLIKARCIRNWGTTDGLAELVNGPTVNTKLDAPATIRLAPDAIVFQLDVCQEKWKDFF